MSDASYSYVERTLKSARTFLSRWQGSRGEMAELTLSHRTFCIVLRYDGKPGNLVISCVDPHTIKGSVRWTGSDISIEATTDAEGEAGFVVRDEAANLEVVCGAIEVSENVKRYGA